jgi:FixJ family two-component response regulator
VTEGILRGVVHLICDDVADAIVVEQQLAAHYRVLTYGSTQQFLDGKPQPCRPGCILLGTSMPGLVGPKLHTLLARSGSVLPIVFLTESATDDAPSAWLVQQIEKAMMVSRNAALSLKLTPMQKKLLRRFADRKSDTDIAEELGIREKMIAAQRCKIMRVFRVRAHAQLEALADRLAPWPHRK